MIGVAIAPGATDTTRMPCGASSLATDCAKSFIPPFDAQQWLKRSHGMTSWTLEIITIAPCASSARMMRAASRVHRKVPVRLTSTTFSHSSSGMSTSSKGFSTPAFVDQQVEAAERLAGLGEAALHVGLVADVHLDRHGPPAGRLDRRGHRPRIVDLAAVVDGHGGAVRGERERGALADAAGGAGDERATAFQQSRVGRMEGEVVIGHGHGLPD